MGSVAAPGVHVVAAGLGISVDLHDFDFVVFLGRALTALAIGVGLDAGPMTFSGGLVAFL